MPNQNVFFACEKRVRMVRVSNPFKTPAEVIQAYSHEYSITISELRGVPAVELHVAKLFIFDTTWTSMNNAPLSFIY